MAKKIEILGSFLIVTDTISGLIESPQPIPAKEMTWNESALQDGRVVFETTRFLSESTEYELYPPFSLSIAVDSNLITFTESTFRTFCADNLGKSSAGVSATNQIIVNQSNKDVTLGGVIDSTKEYFLDGIIDMGTTEITVPNDGIILKGYSFANSGLISSEDNYTMFKTLIAIAGGGGGLLMSSMFVSVTGSGSKVYDMSDSDGQHAIELDKFNYINCTSLGVLDGYRQGLELDTGRFGGSPSLTLSGAWLGGYRVSTSIVRNMSNTTAEPLFKKGIDFVMQSRFLTDINCDLGTLQPLLDFEDTNFPNPSTLEIKNAIITRNGLSVPNDLNITPNITASNLSCSWRINNGIPNTFVGAIATITTEVETGVTGGLPFILLGTFTNTDMQHFDSPSNGQLRHLGDNPREYTVNFDFSLDGGANQTYQIDLIKNDGLPSIVYSQRRVINNLQGGGSSRDIGYFTGLANVILNKNDYVYWQISNLTNNNNCTLELDSSWSVEER